MRQKMKKKVRITVADSAGNITVFVKDRFERAQYQNVASKLLAMEELGAEQVAFILDAPECGRAEGKMEMCGLEFCGNASRAFALMIAEEKNISGEGEIFLDVSGCDEIVTVKVDTEKKWAKIRMPSCIGVYAMDLSHMGIRDREKLKNVTVVDFGGILHLIVKDVEPTRETFDAIKECVMKSKNTPALGVMFFDAEKQKLTPVVYVRDVNTTYFEGSCGSGATACAIAFSIGKKDGEYKYRFVQPAGIIEATAELSKGEINAVYIESEVSCGEEITVEIELQDELSETHGCC